MLLCIIKEFIKFFQFFCAICFFSLSGIKYFKEILLSGFSRH